MSLKRYLLFRKIFVIPETLEPNAPFQVTAEPQILCRTGLDPRVEYNLGDLGDPSLKLLLLALDQNPPYPEILIQSTLENSALEQMDIAVHLVLALPKNSDQLIGSLVTLYPEKRMEIAESLKELILLRKTRINALVEHGLCLGAKTDEREAIHQLIEEASAQVVHVE